MSVTFCFMITADLSRAIYKFLNALVVKGGYVHRALTETLSLSLTIEIVENSSIAWTE